MCNIRNSSISKQQQFIVIIATTIHFNKYNIKHSILVPLLVVHSYKASLGTCTKMVYTTTTLNHISFISSSIVGTFLPPPVI